LHTFFSLETGNQWAHNFFLKGKSDDVKAEIFGCNRRQWKSIEEDVKVWVLDNWEGWEETEPGFFTEVFKAGVDDNWLPQAEVERQRLEGGGVRRRSSVGEKMGGASRRKSSATILVGPH
jgi:hypothetical protein